MINPGNTIQSQENPQNLNPESYGVATQQSNSSGYGQSRQEDNLYDNLGYFPEIDPNIDLSDIEHFF